MRLFPARGGEGEETQDAESGLNRKTPKDLRTLYARAAGPGLHGVCILDHVSQIYGKVIGVQAVKEEFCIYLCSSLSLPLSHYYYYYHTLILASSFARCTYATLLRAFRHFPPSPS